ncbi:hypothetical protein LXL04_039019 [Taraxacum kok-saghyz]
MEINKGVRCGSEDLPQSLVGVSSKLKTLLSKRTPIKDKIEMADEGSRIEEDMGESRNRRKGKKKLRLNTE